ncbi:hypothetical protein AUC70_11855 [Methyloceanibacter stevinii]|uniref:Uncharacterized protein n=1 Tax=Methyloceanibacter stevinii TaxID=1774970 RepID=A0A1E3VJ44_9HYPH|nr:hypothetical protein [Methyloceanibacter stevinii]ODR93550.1 hypothetical protein AUC70_11855 [Methyloceanibacter stevinii]
MALSHDLQSLSAWFNELAEGRAEFTLEGVACFRACLERAVDDAMALENTPVVVTSELAPAKQVDNVVYLRPRASQDEGGSNVTA